MQFKVSILREPFHGGGSSGREEHGASCCPGSGKWKQGEVMAFPLPSSNGSGKAQLELLERQRDSKDAMNDECDNDRNLSSLTA